MKKVLFALAALAAIPAFSSTPAAAADRRFCTTEFNGPLVCYYDTYAQCQATASGTFARCVENPVFVAQSYYGYGDQPPVRARRHHRRVD